MTQLKLIPREPTDKQVEAALNSDVGVLDSTLRELYTLIYQAMVDAAPHVETETEKKALHYVDNAEDRCPYAVYIIRALLLEREIK